jgi:uncharacterized membrane protein YozB (DUF420 family)
MADPAVREHRFYTSMAVIAAVLTLGGFASVYGPDVAAGSVPLIVHLHAAVFTSWLVLFIVQTQLVAARRVSQHRSLGTAGMFLAALMLIVGLLTARDAARSGHTGVPGVIFPDASGFLLLNVMAIAAFTILVALGWTYRRKAQAHKRLMLMATVAALMPPGLSRLPFVSGHEAAIAGIVLVFLLIPPAYDLVTRRRVHPAYVFAVVLALLTIPPVVTVMAATQAWQRVAALLVG